MDKDSWGRIVISAPCPAWPKYVFFGHISKSAYSSIAIASGSLAVHTMFFISGKKRCVLAGFLPCNCQFSTPHLGQVDQRSTLGENLT
jgi:hypothetical protein